MDWRNREEFEVLIDSLGGRDEVCFQIFGNQAVCYWDPSPPQATLFNKNSSRALKPFERLKSLEMSTGTSVFWMSSSQRQINQLSLWLKDFNPVLYERKFSTRVDRVLVGDQGPYGSAPTYVDPDFI